MKNLANENQTVDTQGVIDDLTVAIEKLLDGLLIDWTTDPNTQDTPKRVAKMYATELLAGRFTPMPKATVFPNTRDVDELYTVGPIPITGVCSHHFLPITGHVWIGIIPSDKLLGLSKFARIAQWVFSRPQIQEEATCQLAEALEELLEPKGLVVICKADHACMALRGVKSPSQMTTSVVKGLMTGASAKAEFLEFVKGMDF